MDEEEVGLSKEQYITMKKHESREEGSPLDVIAAWGADVWEPDVGLWCGLKPDFEEPSASVRPLPSKPQFLNTVCVTHPAGVQAAFGW